MANQDIDIKEIEDFTNDEVPYLKIRVVEISGHRRLDVRKYFTTGDNTLAPTKKGVALSPIELDTLLGVLDNSREAIYTLLRGEEKDAKESPNGDSPRTDTPASPGVEKEDTG